MNMAVTGRNPVSIVSSFLSFPPSHFIYDVVIEFDKYQFGHTKKKNSKQRNIQTIR